MYFGASSHREFTNPMHAVVGIGAENKRTLLSERECLSDKFERPRRICGKDDGIASRRLKG